MSANSPNEVKKEIFILNTFKSILIKLSATVALAFTGLVALNTTSTAAKTVQAASVSPSVVTINYVPGYGINVWNQINGYFTGQRLKHGTSWKVIRVAKDSAGNTWYDLGRNQWVMGKYTVAGYSLPAAQAPKASNAEASAKAWIAQRESGNNYYARNGQYIGKYQLSAAYLGGNYSPANQERVANQYVASRYGSWVNAKAFWLTHGWY